jgi:hypothetical protein
MEVTHTIVSKIELPSHPAIPLLVIRPKETKFEYKIDYLHTHVYFGTLHGS